MIAKRQRISNPRLRASLGKASFEIPAHTAEIVPLQIKLKPLLKRDWVGGSEKDISWLTADLAALWEVSRVHIILVEKLLKMKSKPTKRLLEKILIDLEINWVSNASGHLKTLERELVKFRESL